MWLKYLYNTEKSETNPMLSQNLKIQKTILNNFFLYEPILKKSNSINLK